MIRALLPLCFAAMCVSSTCWSQTPHTLLWNSTPEDGQKALEMMKNDPTWVTKRDSDDRTPLHVAARFNHTEVVKWLLGNGADVDAQAYNRFTPLHLTKNFEIVKLILEKKPDLTLKSVTGTPLQAAIADLRHYDRIRNRAPDTKRQVEALRKIVDAYVKHLGDNIDIISAVRLGELATVRRIVNQNPATANRQGHGPTPLREAANWGQFAICKFLIEEHSVDIDDFEGGTGYPIIKAAVKHPRIVKYLVEQGADLKTRITWNGLRTGVWIIGDDATVLHYAAADGVPATIKILLDAGVDPFATAHDSFDKKDKQTALGVAAYFGKTDNAIAILEHPRFSNAAAKFRQHTIDESLLIASCFSWLAFESQDRSELLDALLRHGANINVTNNRNHLPIQIAVSQISPDNEKRNKNNKSVKKVVAVLRKHGAELDVFSAVAIGDFQSLEKLLDEAPDASNAYFNGYSALHMAIKMNQAKAVRMLLDAGCDVDIRNKSESTGWKGGTPLLCVAFWGHEEIAKLLISEGADVNATSEKQVTPLHEAVRLGNAGIAKLLLENGAKKQARDHEGKTPLDWASDAAKFTDLFSQF